MLQVFQKLARTKRASQKSITVPAQSAAMGLVLVLLASVSAGYFGAWVENRRAQDFGIPGNTRVNQQVVLNESQLINQVAKSVSPSVVSVDVTSESAAGNGFFGFSQPAQQQSAGTGVIISSTGIVITNRHVMPKDTTAVSVTLSDGTKLDNVEVIGRTNDNDSLDVAFLRIKDTKGKKLQAATLGDSSKVQVGDKVVAIGNALGEFQNTVTSGIISGFGRNIRASDRSGGASEALQNLLQTDAAINEGNSGGPLVNINGEVIAINTAVAGGQAQNVGFAIPINDVQGLIKGILQQGKLLRPYLGVRYVAVDESFASQNSLSVKQGAYVAAGGSQPSIVSGSPAEKAGLKDKDIITKVDNTDIDATHSLTTIIGTKSVGDRVTLTIVREGKTITVPVTLEAVPSQ